MDANSIRVKMRISGLLQPSWVRIPRGISLRFGLVTYDAVTFVYDALKYGRSVRCLRDEPVSEAQSYSSGAKFFGYAARRPRVFAVFVCFRN